MGEQQPISPQEPFVPSIEIEGSHARVTVRDLMRATNPDDIYTMFHNHSKTWPDIPIHIVFNHPDTKIVFKGSWVKKEGGKPATTANVRNGSLNPIVGIRVENVFAQVDEQPTVLRPEEGTEVVVWARHETSPPSLLTFERIISPHSSK